MGIFKVVVKQDNSLRKLHINTRVKNVGNIKTKIAFQ